MENCGKKIEEMGRNGKSWRVERYGKLMKMENRGGGKKWKIVEIGSNGKSWKWKDMKNCGNGKSRKWKIV